MRCTSSYRVAWTTHAHRAGGNRIASKIQFPSGVLQRIPSFTQISSSSAARPALHQQVEGADESDTSSISRLASNSPLWSMKTRKSALLAQYHRSP